LTEGGDLQRTGLSWSREVVQRSGAWIALLALVVQIAASFGHMHARDIAGDIGSRIADGWHQSTVTQAAASNPADIADDEDQCPICFSASLLATSFVPHAVQPVTVVELHDVNYDSARAFLGVLEPRRAAFQSRAPPSA
jgi:hypothetical protein